MLKKNYALNILLYLKKIDPTRDELQTNILV